MRLKFQKQLQVYSTIVLMSCTPSILINFCLTATLAVFKEQKAQTTAELRAKTKHHTEQHKAKNIKPNNIKTKDGKK